MGADGKSAYQLAVADGFVGTESAWLASLVGADGVGEDGVSIIWHPQSASHPTTGVTNGYAYYNTTQKKSYVYQDNTWYQMSADGQPGVDAVPFIYKGESATAPLNPVLNWWYRDSSNGKAYIWDGHAWELFVQDGETGATGATGANGKPSYTHFKYSNDGGQTFTFRKGIRRTSSGAIRVTSSGAIRTTKGDLGDVDGSWLGRCSSFDPIASNNVWDYKWTKIKGADGNGMVSEKFYYQITTSTTAPSVTSADWGTDRPIYDTQHSGKYLWAKREVVYTDTSKNTASIYIDNDWSAADNAFKSSLKAWFTNADSSNITQLFNEMSAINKPFTAVMEDGQEIDGTVYEHKGVYIATAFIQSLFAQMIEAGSVWTNALSVGDNFQVDTGGNMKAASGDFGKMRLVNRNIELTEENSSITFSDEDKYLTLHNGSLSAITSGVIEMPNNSGYFDWNRASGEPSVKEETIPVSSSFITSATVLQELNFSIALNPWGSPSLYAFCQVQLLNVDADAVTNLDSPLSLISGNVNKSYSVSLQKSTTYKIQLKFMATLQNPGESITVSYALSDAERVSITNITEVAVDGLQFARSSDSRFIVKAVSGNVVVIADLPTAATEIGQLYRDSSGTVKVKIN